MVNRPIYILIIDDSQANIELLIELLSFENYKIDYALDGESGLQKIKSKSFDMILLDIMMPSPDGFEVCRQIKADPETKNIPIIFITARTDEKSILKGLQLGAVDFITMPFNQEELMARLKVHVELYTSRKIISRELKERRRVEAQLQKSQSQLLLRNRFAELFAHSNSEFYYNILQLLMINFECTYAYIGIISNSDFIEEHYLSNQNTDLASSEIVTHTNIKKLDLLYLNSIKNQEVTSSIDKVISPDGNHSLNSSIAIPLVSNHDVIALLVLGNKTTEYFTEANKDTLQSLSQYISPLFNEKLLRETAEKERQQLQRKILHTVIETEDRERKHFAENLHDDLGPILSTARMYVKLLKRIKDNPQKTEEIINDSLEIIDEAISTTRSLSNNLNPHLLDNFGLEDALKSFVSSVKKATNIDINFAWSNFDNKLKKETESILYRVFKELINNTIKHANAQKIDILYNSKKSMHTFVYKDNGTGFEEAEILNKFDSGMGLQNIVSRINSIDGEYEIKTVPNKGFKIKFKIHK